MKKLHMKFFKDVSYFNDNGGQFMKLDGTEDNSMWSMDVSFANGFIPIRHTEKAQERLIEYIKDVFDFSNLPAETLAIHDDGNISFMLVEDCDGNQVVGESSDSQLYLCDYVIMLEVHEVTKPTQSELTKMFQGFDTL